MQKLWRQRGCILGPWPSSAVLIPSEFALQVFPEKGLFGMQWMQVLLSPSLFCRYPCLFASHLGKLWRTNRDGLWRYPLCQESARVHVHDLHFLQPPKARSPRSVRDKASWKASQYFALSRCLNGLRLLGHGPVSFTKLGKIQSGDCLKIVGITANTQMLHVLREGR